MCSLIGDRAAVETTVSAAVERDWLRLRDDLAVSFDTFLQGFVGGDSAPGDRAAAIAIVTPLLAGPVSAGSGRIVTADGEADIYGLGDSEQGLMINHASGLQIWQLIVDVARAARYAVLPVGCPVCVVDEVMIGHLPDELRRDAVLIHDGGDLKRAVVNAPAAHNLVSGKTVRISQVVRLR